MAKKQYLITSDHFIYVDNYEKGDGELVGGYDLKELLMAENAREALATYIREVLGFSISDKDLDSIECVDGSFNWSFQVNRENEQASVEEKELWKKGKYVLHTDNTYFEIFELKRVEKI